MSDAGVGPALTVQTVLVPVDGSDESTRAARYAIAIADRYDASLEVVYVLGEEVVRAIERDRLDEETVAADLQAYLDDLRSLADDVDVPMESMSAYGFSPTRKTRHPGSVVLDCAEDVDADFLVIPRESQGEGVEDVLAKTAEYVLLYASQPVLSV